MGDERFRAIDKIKTIGSTYMAAVGLIPEYKIVSEKEDGGISAITYVAQVRISNFKFPNSYNSLIVVHIWHVKLT